MAGYPWSELGLDGPTDERSIRRAYAARLKLVRPDVDAAGFQRLVQARDFALRAIENAVLRPMLRPIVPVDLVPKREEATAPGDASHLDGSTEQPQTKTGPPRPGAQEERPDTHRTEKPAPVTINVNPPNPPPPVATESDPPSAVPSVGGPPSKTDTNVVSALLSAFVTAWTENAVLPPVAPILKVLGELSIVARQKFEIEALRAVTTLLEKGLFDRKTRAARQSTARALIVGFDDEYAWTLNDRRLHAMLPFQGAADQTARLLRIVREWERTGVRPKEAPARPQKALRQSRWVGSLIALGLFAALRVISTSNTKPQTWPPPPLTYLPNDQVRPGAHFPAAPPNSNQAASSSYKKGVAYHDAGDLGRAIEEYSQAIRLDLNYALAYYNRALGYASKRQFARAVEDYNQAIRLNPFEPDSWVSRGVAYDAQGQYDLAIKDYDQALRLKPGYVLALVNRGIAYANKDDYDRAIWDYNQAIRLKPNDPDALYNRGQAKRAKGDIAGGDADIAKAGQSR